MKKINIFFISIIVLLISCANIRHAVDNRTVKEKIESRNFNFIVNNIIGQSNNNISNDYYIYFSNDTIKTYLPYYGISYEAPLDPSKSGISFTSTNYECDVKYNNEKKYHILNVRIKDQRRVILLTLNIWDNGRGDTTIKDQSKQPISFQGELE